MHVRVRTATTVVRAYDMMLYILQERQERRREWTRRLSSKVYRDLPDEV